MRCEGTDGDGQRDGGTGGGVFQGAVMSVIKKWLGC